MGADEMRIHTYRILEGVAIAVILADETETRLSSLRLTEAAEHICFGRESGKRRNACEEEG